MSLNIKENKIYLYAFWGTLFFERSIWSVYLLHQGITMIQIGLLQTVLSTAMFIFEFPSGIFADRFGEKVTLFLGHVFNIIYLSIMLLFPNFPLLLIGFFAYGIGFAMVSGSDQTLLYHYDDGRQYQEKIGLYNAIGIGSLALSSFLGGILSQHSWSIIFIAGISTQFIAFLILLSISGSRKKNKNEEELITFEILLLSLKSITKMNLSLRYLVVAIITFQSILSVLYNFIQLLLVEKGLDSFHISIVMTLALVFSVISSLHMNFLNKKIGKRKSLPIYLIFITITGLLFKLDNIFIVVIAFFIYGFGYEFIDTTLNTVFHDNISDSIRTSLLSAVNTLTSLLMLGGNLLFSFSLKFMEVGNVFFIGIILCTAMTATFLILFNKNYQ
ncbi:MFS transporter [Streptococcus sp. H49]|uniref:MFS transporter n=1 Tax=Streptococcus huangxiaojuni TaxID=3237239 RepID=UPI0034A387BB